MPAAYAITNGSLVDVVENKEADVTLSFEPGGTAKVTEIFADGMPPTPACVVLSSTEPNNFTSKSNCSQTEASVIELINVPVGTYQVKPLFAGAGYTGAVDPVVITIEEGIAVTTIDEAGQPITEVCVVAYKIDDDGNRDSGTSECAFGNSSTTIWGLEPGTYAVEYSSFQYLSAPSELVEVRAEETAATTLQALPSESIDVTLEGPDGNVIPGGCFFVSDPEAVDRTVTAFGCDLNDGTLDGRTTLAPIAVDRELTVLPVYVPDGFGLPRGKSVTVTDGAPGEVTLTVKESGSTVTIHQPDGDANSRQRTCVLIFAQNDGARGRLVTYRCDVQDQMSDGIVHIEGLGPGRYFAVEFDFQNNKELPGETPFRIEEGKETEVSLSER
jgi:hypothetical protein